MEHWRLDAGAPHQVDLRQEAGQLPGAAWRIGVIGFSEVGPQGLELEPGEGLHQARQPRVSPPAPQTGHPGVDLEVDQERAAGALRRRRQPAATPLAVEDTAAGALPPPRCRRRLQGSGPMTRMGAAIPAARSSSPSPRWPRRASRHPPDRRPARPRRPRAVGVGLDHRAQPGAGAEPGAELADVVGHRAQVDLGPAQQPSAAHFDWRSRNGRRLRMTMGSAAAGRRRARRRRPCATRPHRRRRHGGRRR